MAVDLAAELGELLAVDTTSMAPAERVAHVGRLERVRTQISAVSYAALEELEETKAYEVDGSRTAATWLHGHVGCSQRTGQRRARLAVHLRSMPFTRVAFAAGEITEDHVVALAEGVANPRTAGQFAWDERTLVGQAKRTDADEFRQRMRQWTMLFDPDGSEPADPQDDVLYANQVGDRVKLDGDFGLETGLPILAALDEMSDVLYERDKRVAEANPNDGLAMRTPGNRRAEGFYELVMAGAGAGSNPRRRDPLFNVLIDELTLRTMELRADSVIQLMDGRRLSLKLAGMFACDALVHRVVLDGRKAVLNLGRTERYANREQRRALGVRDRGCAVPGCGLPPERCDAHHIVFWDDKGPTDIDNLVLMCRYHHRQVHRKRLRVEMHRGKPRFYDSLGKLIGPGRHRPPSVQAA